MAYERAETVFPVNRSSFEPERPSQNRLQRRFSQGQKAGKRALQTARAQVRLDSVLDCGVQGGIQLASTTGQLVRKYPSLVVL